jgi:hypothetical protein
LKLAVFDFTEGDVVTDFSRTISEELRIYMALHNAELVMIDRASTERIIDEQRLSSSPLFDESKAASVGKLVSADAIVMGALAKGGATKQTDDKRLTVKMISVETGAVIGGYSTWLVDAPRTLEIASDAYALPTNEKPTKRISLHADASCGMQFVNRAPSTGFGIVLSRYAHKGDEKTSRFEKGRGGFSFGVHYYAVLPVKPSHDYVLSYRTVDFWGNPVLLNNTDIYQDNYFFTEENNPMVLVTDNSMQESVTFLSYKAETLRVDRFRVDASWGYSFKVKGIRIYAEVGLAYSKQIDRSTYATSSLAIPDMQSFTVNLIDNFPGPELPSLVEAKGALGVERGRWGIHLEGAVTTRSRNYMSPLDMFHHPEMMNWSALKGDLADDGVGRITGQTASEDWYYWTCSMLQVRFQL